MVKRPKFDYLEDPPVKMFSIIRPGRVKLFFFRKAGRLWNKFLFFWEYIPAFFKKLFYLGRTIWIKAKNYFFSHEEKESLFYKEYYKIKSGEKSGE